jgi:lipoprotein signal peptidase
MTTKSKRSYRWLLWTLAVLGFALDQGTKYGVFEALHDDAMQSLTHRTERVVIPNALQFIVEYTPDAWPEDAGPLQTWSGEHQPHVNRGAFSGLGNGDDGGADFNLIFAVISVLAAGAIVWWSTRRTVTRDGLLCVALGLMLAGTLGNLYDRIVFDGVRDFLYWHFIIPTLVFNLADFFLVCGAGLLLIQAFCGRPAKEEVAARPAMAARPMAQVAEVK